ncbi:Regulator of sigma E protease [Legionella massiliensis]|uniref:Regulator of sigma E protease n=1 Tax=Legionella massiliensis TaxID=1034943 RepID=A0A078KYX7_9GAMM|nr:site-2 protease family protein [Legionella massiliensis]CDZ76959.1 Regulator of sigma E protease [Legionella massiliensis]CEE12697.1 Regulator of sigma-E protease RseP [Legionella massiliensis]
MVLAVVAIVLTLLLVIGIHEAGHAIVARLFGVQIKRISIGFGKTLFSRKDKAGQEWAWSLWPLGGYVQLRNSRIEPVPENEFHLCFDKKPIWQRCLILLAGPLANLLTALLALTFMYMLGYQQRAPYIQEVMPQSIAAQAGIQANERFVAIAGQKTNSWQEVGIGLIMVVGKSEVPVLLSNSQGEAHQVNLDLEKWRYTKQDKSLLTAIGIIPVANQSHLERVAGQSLLSAMHAATVKVLYLLHFFLIMLKLLLTKVIPFSVLLGPLGIFSASISSFLQGIAVFLYFIASFSLSVGLVNLFPVPGLDGASIVYALVEKCRGQPVSVAFEILLHNFAVIIFALVLVQLLMNDLQRFIH